jgi:hypothetical protein
VARSLHGKMFLAYRSNIDRLHVWDGTNLRRTGLIPQYLTPTAVDSGAAGTLSGTRYYRQRGVVMSGTTILLRSEPSAVLTFHPAGTFSSITITKAASTGEGETHWELEASLDNANFYRLARTLVATPTVIDTTSVNSGYNGYPLAEGVEDYALIPSCRYLAVDTDRLIWAGSYEQPALDARVGWTPVYAADGVGNDERMETDTDPFRDLDAQDTGRITGLSDSVLGANWVFKQRAIYKMIRTGVRTNAYEFDKYTDVFGAIPGSVVEGVDGTGQPCLYFLDRDQGPCRLGMGGIKKCGEDLRRTWETINVDAAAVAPSVLFSLARRDFQAAFRASSAMQDAVLGALCDY